MCLQVAVRKGEHAVRESKTREMGLQGRLKRVHLELMVTKAEVADLRKMVDKGRQNLRETRMQYKADQEQLEGALRKSKEREMGWQGRLKEAEVELRHTKMEVADLREMVEKGRQDLGESRMQHEMDQERLMIANHTTREELKTVRDHLDIATRDLSDARKGKESLEVCYRSLRGMSISICCCVCHYS